MSQILNWEKLLIEKSYHSKEQYNKKEQNPDARKLFTADVDKIIFSRSFRRLAKKTQVHPLCQNDQVHNRLTHSLETASVGRSLGYKIGVELIKNAHITNKNIQPSDIAEIVKAACLAHDLGNPAFGHVGEDAIRYWFANPENQQKYLKELTSEQIADFTNFDGNAQSFRVINRIEYNHNQGGMRLTYPVIASMVKYPYSAEKAVFNKKTKFGYYQADKEIFSEIFSELGLEKNGIYLRHPLSFLTEAADDLCYSIIDLEDALEMKIINFTQLLDVFEEILTKEIREKVLSNDNNKSNIDKAGYLRSKCLGICIDKVCDTFLKYLPKIMDGELEGSIIDYAPKNINNYVKKAKELAREKIYTEKEKTKLEIGSYSVYQRLLDNIIPTLCEVYKLKSKDDLILNKELSVKSKLILQLMSPNIPQKQDSLYATCLSGIDFIAGMTDNYATDLAKSFLGLT